MKKPWKVDPFDESCSDLENITIRLNEDDSTVTLTGLPYRDFKSLLVGASLYRSDRPFVPQYVENPDGMIGEMAIENALENQRWSYAQEDLIGYLIGLMNRIASGGLALDPKASIVLGRKTRRLSPEPHYTTVSPEQKEKTKREKMLADLNEARSTLVAVENRIRNLVKDMENES